MSRISEILKIRTSCINFIWTSRCAAWLHFPECRASSTALVHSFMLLLTIILYYNRVTPTFIHITMPRFFISLCHRLLLFTPNHLARAYSMPSLSSISLQHRNGSAAFEIANGKSTWLAKRAPLLPIKVWVSWIRMSFIFN